MTDSKMPELHRSFPDAGDGRPMPPMGDELMTAGLNPDDARFVAAQLAQNGLALVPAAPVADAELEALVDGWARLIDDAEREIAMEAEVASHSGERHDLWDTHVFLDLHTAKVTLAAIRACTAQPVGVSDEVVEAAAVAIWREELGDTAPTVKKSRTLGSFRDQLPEMQAKFKRFARAALLPEGGA